MRRLQEATAVIVTATLVTTGRSSSGAKTSGTQQPSGIEAARTEAADNTAKTKAAKDAASGDGEPVLVVYTARSGAPNSTMIPQLEEGTGIKVEVVVIGIGKLLKRVRSEKNNPLGDIFRVADQTMLSTSEDLLMRYVSSENENMLDAFHNIIGYLTPVFADPTVVIVNEGLKGDMEIEGSGDLLSPELKGKVTFGGPVNSGSAFWSLLVMLYGMGEDGGPPSGRTWVYVDQFITNLGDKMADSSNQVYKDVAEGKYVVGLTWEDLVANYVKEGAAVGVVSPREGAVLPGESVQILKDCRYPENTKELVDYMLSEKIQNAVGSNLTVRPLRKGAKLADYMAPQSGVKLFDNYNEGWIAEHKTEITNLFSEHIETSMD